MTVLRHFVEALHNLERNNIGWHRWRGGNYRDHTLVIQELKMLIIRLYSGPVFVGDEEEQDNDTTTDAEDAAAAGSFAA
ncbi:MAG: hypothetical protein ACTH8H_18045 [Serratia proteamaculans]|uniref:Uncharacterized protein n=1 Tax=Serratia proteamaculans TaxID=28151 RepID=A0ABS0TQ73_SERPR|nr:hypothetical protein [Serratia proteamaculans]HBL6727292.1 hypothetical protein [Serratia liquefaciens]KAB1496439.1 hypothetical protein F8R23_09500 [Serratia proteamaculans]MBI6180503.1 hypothetical protein [Serratia proteamaculans]NWA73426.1 hypothetical protein [Serratia proteamaculans]RYM51440.1 hypothetical protein BSQ97_11775 [Serratia proteamaculans]